MDRTKKLHKKSWWFELFFEKDELKKERNYRKTNYWVSNALRRSHAQTIVVICP